ncbi:hypothetical protein PoB_006091100 [Plakobranchus ocellatus]|uniref:Uncharacterized protein n=1 Tax=Plakobranchus ocellatus TaxID=259542 RepID=A0AAV4CR83_9GAST|nr:hypothetical protein PoB_006091100 [Plakobranchus ocellatus]
MALWKGHVFGRVGLIFRLRGLAHRESNPSPKRYRSCQTSPLWRSHVFGRVGLIFSLRGLAHRESNPSSKSYRSCQTSPRSRYPGRTTRRWGHSAPWSYPNRYSQCVSSVSCFTL